ncbi:DNA-binding transcriptional regulator, GntR family [Variovorax sp. HW608]|uniref:GntR family transcriptional regulator n=1 Tax=Variovorax sp. HW608 TaxID=1034889 RepID=UPI0008200DCC|nr:FCD domain-containing protein [Variovorax sp. HW608]SCK15416.1 DNA-binding transcriptional regulator, GntR family [Variovorax sp. HW608]SCK15489.1 DNA-binding transcriptional regulator, GntR family [Variovorax sp. HW608]
MSAIPQPKSSLTQSAYERLKGDLLACRLEPDERLNISELCGALGVSLGAVREALSRLTSEGLVVAEPQRGFRVASISEDELRDLYRTRIEIEALCLRRAIEVGSLRWESNLVAAYHSLSRTPEAAPGHPAHVGDEWLQRHADFHEALVSGGDSPWLMRLRTQLFQQSQRYRRLSVSLAKTKRNVDKEHRELMEAVLARDADRAVALMRDHLQLTTKILLAASRA